MDTTNVDSSYYVSGGGGGGGGGGLADHGGGIPAIGFENNTSFDDDGDITPAIFEDVNNDDFGFGFGGCNFSNSNSCVSYCNPFNTSASSTSTIMVNASAPIAVDGRISTSPIGVVDYSQSGSSTSVNGSSQTHKRKHDNDDDAEESDEKNDDIAAGGGLLSFLGREFRKRMSSSTSSTTKSDTNRGSVPDKATSLSSTAIDDSSNQLNGTTGDVDVVVDDDDDDDNTTDELATDLAQMTVDQRNFVLEDIHGVHTFNEEDPKYIDECIEQVYKEIQKIPNSSRTAYNKANFLAPTKVSKNRKFNVMFLRASSYDTRQAAKRIVKHFDFKQRLFGNDKLVKDITYDDLMEDDLNAYKSGYSLVLPGKDCTGRAVVVMSSKYTNCKTWENQLRANWYQMMAAFQDESVQIRGIVLVPYEVDRNFSQVQNHSLKDRLSSIPMYQEALPIRIASMHHCFNNPTINTVIKLFSRMYDKGTRMRFRFHSGGHVECQYALMSYGLPSSLFPYDHEGNMKEGFIDRCIESSKAAYPESELVVTDTVKSCSDFGDDANNNMTGSNIGDYVEVATDRDVLLGRGVPYQSHPGNIQLAKLIEEKDELFSKASKFDKTVITWDLVKVIQDEYGGRFLERDCDGDKAVASSAANAISAAVGGGAWRVCTNEAARAKVAVGFRSRLKMQRRKQNGRQQKNQSEQEKRQKFA